MYKSAQNARQTGRGFFNKLREGLDFSGMAQEKLFRASGADLLDLYNQEQLVGALIKLFKQRMLY